ncbi:PREDICTED: sialin-like [Diuraphis noxia]|uniref:sialin-like n=1 Tax=Diuraphis noxia TaxID=143948 RepID=UPI00076399DD|nr:PREDICTED: sialin-like [Diuraphis noxia]
MSNHVAHLAPKPKLWGSCRFSIAFCVFLASVQMAMLRDNLGIALLCMSKPVGNFTCEPNDATVIPTLPWIDQKKNCEFEWDSATRGRLLGSFMYGYISTTMAGGIISNNYGAKLPFMIAVYGNIIFHMLCPSAALIHTELFFACRFIQGMFVGLMAGPFFQLFSAWMSDDESSILLSFGFSGFSFGTILSYPMSGFLCGSNVHGFGGWSLIFYVPAIISISFIFYFHRYLYDVPDNHPKISPEEYTYLFQNVGVSQEPPVIPWLSIFTSLPFIAYMLCYSAFLWNVFTMMNLMPMYLQTMLGIQTSESGYLYCIPFILTFLMRNFNAITYPMVKDFSGLSHTACRKLYCCFGCIMVITSLLSIIFEENITKLHIMVAISINLALGDFAYSGGFFPTLLDLAPNYAGLLSGLSTFIAFLVACPSTLINSIIIKQNTREEWNTVLWIIVAMFIFIMCFYLIFGSASLQLWSIDKLEIPERGTFRTTLFNASRSMSVARPTHIF